MNTDHVIKDARAAQESREAAAQTWINFVRDCRTARWMTATWLGVFALCPLMGALFVSSRPELRLVYFPPVAFLALTSPILFLAQRRREEALLRMVAMEAPILTQKLQAEGIGLRS